MKKPELSVILPFHNSEETIEQAIESILAQTFTNFELILIDNNSADSSYDIAADYASKDTRINILDEPEKGIVKALNTSIRETSAPIIARMDADDISLPTRLEKQIAYLKDNPEVDAVACQAEHVQQEENQLGLGEYVRWSNRLIYPDEISACRFIESPVIHPTMCFRKELIDKYGEYKHGYFPEDYEMWLRWLDNDVIIAKLNEVLYCWTDRPERLSRTDDRYSEQAFYEIKTAYLFNYLKGNNKFFPKVAVWGAGRVSRKRFALLHELGIEAKFYIDINENPKRKVIQYKHTPVAGNNFILSYVANRGAREEIREFLRDLGYTEGKDFLCLS